MNSAQREPSLPAALYAVTASEYKLLRVLSLGAGRMFTNDELIRRVWTGPNSGGAEHLRTLMKKLRRKLGDNAAQPTFIFYQRGAGYRMALPD